ncbi:MAG: hypothetical protein JO182_17605 [Acidobacteriaceae bacterium]|nr:hypothetical protein [Acidobacteriaceae bacterium]
MADGLTDSKVNSIAEDRDGNIWIGTIVGLNRFREGKFVAWLQSDGLVHNDVRFILQARDGSLWIGTVGGLSHFKDGTFTNYTTANGLTNNQVRDIFELESGGFWIATYGGGLSYLKNGHFTSITTEQGLFDDFVSRILPDDHDNFWFLSNHGIFRVKRSELEAYVAGHVRSITSVSYGVADGMISSEGNGGAQPAGWKAADGRLWFPTIKGVAIIDPNQPEPPPPFLAIEEVLIDGKPVAPHQAVEIKPGNQELEIHYTALSFTRPELVQFQYRLEGLNTGWVSAGTRRIVNYSHLPPGHYSFVVTADNGSGVWNTQGKSLAVTVVPAFWQTQYFIALCLAVLCGMVAWLYRWRVAHLHRRQRQQEAFSRQLIESQEAERKRIAAELHDSLGQNLLIIKNCAALGLLTSKNLDSAKRQLDAISVSATQAIDEARQIAYGLRPYHLDRLGLQSSLEDMIERVAASSGIRFSSNLAAINGALPKEAEISLYRVVQECINNIVKHSHATEAEVLIMQQDHALRIKIEDNGKGIDAKAPWDGKQRGFGLIGIAERVKMLGGAHGISSPNGKGTAVEIVIPLTQERKV